MSYRKPSTAVYQLLENAGGAANNAPDLETVVIGPLYNVLDVDVTDGASLANTKSTEIPQWTDAATELSINAFELPFNQDTAYPGQEVVASSVHVVLAGVEVQTFAFEYDLKLNATKLDKASFEVSQVGAGFGDAGTDPLVAMPGGYGAHVKPGDILLGENLNGKYRSTVVAVEKDPATNKVYIRAADPINYTDSSVSMLTTFKVYRQFDTFKVTDSASIDTTDVNGLVPMVKLSVYAKPFPSANNPTDYVFRSPAETVGGEAIDVYVGYVAQRKDTVSTILSINGPDDLKGKLGTISERNPLALGVSIAQQNTITPVKAVAVESDTAEGYRKALDLLESDRVYFLAPLTQDVSILQMFLTHAKQMSDPVEAMWRIVLGNTAIPDSITVVEKVVGIDDTGSGSTVSEEGAWMLKSEDHTFLSSGVTPGDILTIHSGSDNNILGDHVIEKVINNQVLQIRGTLAVANNIVFSITREMTKLQQAEAVAAASKSFGSARMVHVQPDVVGIKLDGVMKYLPGYYLACGLAGMGAGFPVQQGFTNIGVVGINDLRHSNYYFSREQLNEMAGAGTCLFVQDTQGGLPYCRHELTTDMSVLEYREILKVKNWDYLSYFYKDLLDPFIGTWNITDDTLSAMRQSIISASERLMTQKLPKIGAPLMSYNIEKLEQNPNSLDTTDIRIKTGIVSPNNYNDVSLVI